ncbi:MAG: 2-keto-4-pentenoate hydratase [bacterium]|nr:2-keto-4-pentenoate hydratase [bacterium]
MDTAGIAAIADEFDAAYADLSPIDQVSLRFPDLTLDDAYAIQLEQIRRRIALGARIVGHKVGLTSRAMQKQLDVDQPDFGHLTDDMVFIEHAVVPMDRFLQPRIEPEIAFVLRSPLAGPGVGVAEALAAVDFVLPAMEIIDSRVRDWKIGLLDTIADNASSAGIVLGSTPVRVDSVDLRLSGCVMTRNGEVATTGAGGAVLGSPISALAWLANTLGRLGVTLEAGHVILPGSQTPSIAVVAGDVFTARFGGIGSVTTRFGSST